jgi:N-methylhydantoinase A/oxoprolinase/acetone carboxylase beta subunit
MWAPGIDSPDVVAQVATAVSRGGVAVPAGVPRAAHPTGVERLVASYRMIPATASVRLAKQTSNLFRARSEERRSRPGHRRRLDDSTDFAAVQAIFDEGFIETREVLSAAKVDPSLVTEDRLADVRYVWQGSELTVGVPKEFFETGEISGLLGAFEEAHRQRFGRILPGVPAEVVNWRGRAHAPAPAMAAPQLTR